MDGGGGARASHPAVEVAAALDERRRRTLPFPRQKHRQLGHRPLRVKQVRQWVCGWVCGSAAATDAAAAAVSATAAGAAGAAAAVGGSAAVGGCVLDAHVGFVDGLARHRGLEGAAHRALHGLVPRRDAAAVAHAHVHELAGRPGRAPPPHAQQRVAPLEEAARGHVGGLAAHLGGLGGGGIGWSLLASEWAPVSNESSAGKLRTTKQMPAAARRPQVGLRWRCKKYQLPILFLFKGVRSRRQAYFGAHRRGDELPARRHRFAFVHKHDAHVRDGVLPGLRQKTHTKQTKAARARVGLAQKKKKRHSRGCVAFNTS